MDNANFPRPTNVTMRLSRNVRHGNVTRKMNGHTNFKMRLITLNGDRASFSARGKKFCGCSFRFRVNMVTLKFVRLKRGTINVRQIALLPNRVIRARTIIGDKSSLVSCAFLFFDPEVHFVYYQYGCYTPRPGGRGRCV